MHDKFIRANVIVAERKKKNHFQACESGTKTSFRWHLLGAIPQLNGQIMSVLGHSRHNLSLTLMITSHYTATFTCMYTYITGMVGIDKRSSESLPTEF